MGQRTSGSGGDRLPLPRTKGRKPVPIGSGTALGVRERTAFYGGRLEHGPARRRLPHARSPTGAGGRDVIHVLVADDQAAARPWCAVASE